MPLLITDDGGKLLYKSRTFPKSDAAFIIHATADTPDGILHIEQKSIYLREVLLSGKRYRFYMDFDRLTECYGFSAERASEALFDLSALAKQRQTIPLNTLTHLFADEYARALRDGGVKLSLRALAQSEAVNIPINAVLLCLTLMVRLCALHGKAVRLSAVRDSGFVTLYADADCSAQPSEAGEVLETLLHEVAAAAGLSAAYTETDGHCAWSLCLAPPDIGMAGFKVPLANVQANCRVYAEMFL